MKPSIPKGTRDFGPDQVDRRQYIFSVIREAFVRYGYRPIETPAMESLDTLTGKYGEEGDQLLFKVLNNGDFLSKADAQAWADRDSNRIVLSISKRGLRYDLTVPFARFVVMNQNDLSFPFKRYQIQPVWRADRPQKGRYQEFFQCDADVIGSDSLMYEAELIRLYDEAFHKLGIPVEIRVNNRKLLASLAAVCGIGNRFMDMTMAIDKADKIGWEGVRREMVERGIPEAGADQVIHYLAHPDLETLRPVLSGDPEGLAGLAEMDQISHYLEGVKLTNPWILDLTLARGLNYYTGCIFEVKAIGVEMGSIGGGGRYADLTGVFGLKGMSGVGISFGADRIYDVMDMLNLFPANAVTSLKVLICAFSAEDHLYAFRVLNQLRDAGVSADLYPEPVKLQKQLKYANSLGVPHVVLIGETERESGLLTCKNMVTGDQQVLDIQGLVEKLTNQ
ncbi:MAG: histidine--tRNA ligase [Saprospiraceae bacterium]|nr:histidine--tRNA ligase [Saprospiraceae bacterium]